MATQHNGIQQKVKESIEQAQQKLQVFEEEAQKVMTDLLEKGKAQRKELGTLLNKVQALEILEKVPVKDLQGRAKGVRRELTGRLEELVERAVTFAGVASVQQVEELSREITKLNKKLDKLSRGGASAKNAPKAKA